MSHLTSEQRYTISVLLKQGESQTKIAETIGKNKSVVNREIHRNKDQRNGEYKADLANRKYLKRQKEKSKKKKFTDEIKQRAEELIRKEYSPEQIVGHCKDEGLDCVSHELIYQHVWLDKKAGGELYSHLRRKGRKYRKRGNSKDARGILKDRVGIEQRPAIVENKERIGDLEIDTIIGKNHKGAIVTINDRVTGMLKMAKVKRRTAENVRNEAIILLDEWKPFIKTITSDNGKEFADHKCIAKTLDIDFFFARPYHSWQRGANENLNGLIRQYIPKKTDFSTISDDYIKEIENKLNNRPRKRFDFKSPIFTMNKLLNQEKLHL